MKKGEFLSSPLFTFCYIYNNKEPQYAVVIPKSVTKKAFFRNKLKRQGYSILRSLPISHGVGILFYKKRGVDSSFKEIEEDINSLFKKAKIIS